jgi:hypothetical protein
MSISISTTTSVPIYLKADYPTHAVLQVGDAYIPVRLDNGRIVDVWTCTPKGIRAFWYSGLQGAWDYIADKVREAKAD